MQGWLRAQTARSQTASRRHMRVWSVLLGEQGLDRELNSGRVKS